MQAFSESEKNLILLCMATSKAAKSFSAANFHALLTALEQNDIALEGLLDSAALQDVLGQQECDRIRILLAQEVPAQQIIALCHQRDIHFMTLFNAKSPHKLKKLKSAQPAFLHYLGKNDLLERRKLAVTGARDASYEAIEHAKQIGRMCAQQKVCIVTGGARGIDRAALNEALIGGGGGIIIVPYGLISASSIEGLRHYRDQNVLVMSKEHPRAEFAAYRAIERNALLYALSDAAVAVSANERKGGTFSGAKNCLTHALTQLYCIKSTPMPEGNRALIEHYGAKVLFSAEIMQNNLNLSRLFEKDESHAIVDDYEQITLKDWNRI